MLAPNELNRKKIHVPQNKLTVPFWGVLQKKFFDWNEKWRAPYDGMFAYQGNNLIRYYEYPWAFYAVRLRKGMKALDFGAGLCGFQFVLSKCGLTVHNVDPGLNAKGIGWSVDQVSIKKLNKKFGTDVKLYNDFIEKAKLPSSHYDVVYCISVMEHLTGSELTNAMKEIARVLKPGGHLVMTTDLFPNIYPFTKVRTNRWGKNVSIKDLVAKSGLRLVAGKKDELFGYPQFNAQKILENLEKYFISSNYPALIQTLVLQKTK